MDFTVEFYETGTGKCPVREFLDELKAIDPDDFAAVVAGLAKLRNRPFLEKRFHHRDSGREKNPHIHVISYIFDG
jgi:hypothetical protein